MGIDREKLEEIEEKIKAIESDSSLSDKQKRQRINVLEQQKEAVFEEIVIARCVNALLERQL